MATTDEPSKRKANFLDLPRELRDNFYEFALRKPRREYLSVYPNCRGGCLERADHTLRALRRTSRQVAQEAFPVFYNINRFWTYVEGRHFGYPHALCSSPCKHTGTCLCDGALVAVRELELNCDRIFHTYLDVCLSLKSGRWHVNCAHPFGIASVSIEKAAKFTKLASLLTPNIEEYLEQIGGRGLKREDMENIRAILAKHE